MALVAWISKVGTVTEAAIILSPPPVPSACIPSAFTPVSAIGAVTRTSVRLAALPTTTVPALTRFSSALVSENFPAVSLPRSKACVADAGRNCTKLGPALMREDNRTSSVVMLIRPPPPLPVLNELMAVTPGPGCASTNPPGPVVRLIGPPLVASRAPCAEV